MTDLKAIAGGTGGGMSRSEAARHAALVRWKKEAPISASVQQRLAEIRAARLAKQQRKGKAKAGGKGKAKGKAKGAGRAAKPSAARPKVDRAAQAAERAKARTEKQAAREQATAQRKQGQSAQRAARAQAQQQQRAEREKAKAERVKQVADKAKAKAKAKAKPEPKAKANAKPTPEERRADVASRMQQNDEGITGAGMSALGKLASGEGMDKQTADTLEQMGLVERDTEGTPRATTHARALLRAADRGDYGAALDAISRGKDRAAKQREKAGRALMMATVGKAQITRTDAMSDLDPILDDMTATRDAALELAEAAIKAGRRNSSSDQAQLDHGYELAMQLCDLFESLGADTGEEEGEGEMGMDEEMGEEGDMMEGKAIARREDVNPKEGVSEYGDVRFADAKNKKYPIDTEAHVRAAWNYINKPDNAAKYAADEVATIKRNIVSAWKKLIDKDGPPSAETKKSVPDDDPIFLLGTDPTRLGVVDASVRHDDYLYSAYGSEIKSLSDGGIGAYAVRFGSEAEPDMSQMRDYFTKATDFWLDAWDRRPMLFHHAMDEDTEDAPRIGTWTKAEVKDEGVWLEGQLDRHHRYYGAIKELVRRGVLRLSSDSAPHLVRRATKAGGIHEVTRWPLLAASLTPTPAEPRLTAVSFKALLSEYGLEGIDDNPEAHDDDAARSDATKAAEDERARRLLLLELDLDLLAMEATIT